MNRVILISFLSIFLLQKFLEISDDSCAIIIFRTIIIYYIYLYIYKIYINILIMFIIKILQKTCNCEKNYLSNNINQSAAIASWIFKVCDLANKWQIYEKSADEHRRAGLLGGETEHKRQLCKCDACTKSPSALRIEMWKLKRVGIVCCPLAVAQFASKQPIKPNTP